MTDEFVKLTATEAAAEIASGAVSAEEYVRACLDRIEAVDGEIKAFVHLDREHALAQARTLDERRAQLGDHGGVVAGPAPSSSASP